MASLSDSEKQFVNRVINKYNMLSINQIDMNELYQYALFTQLFIRARTNQEQLILPDDYIITGRPDNFFNVDFLVSTGVENPETTSEIINYFLSRTYSKKLLKLNSRDIASLISYVRFSRVPNIKGTPDFKKASEINFDTFYKRKDFSSIVQGNSGCGLKSLKVDVISNTGAYYAYKISMSLYFANANVLVNNPNYTLLLTTPTLDQNKNKVTYSLVLGWADPDPSTKSSQNTEQLTDEHLALLVNLKSYNFGFNMDGSVTLTMDFIGAAESSLEEMKADVLVNHYLYGLSTESISAKIEDAKIKKELLQEDFNSKKDAAENEIASLVKIQTEQDLSIEQSNRLQKLKRDLSESSEKLQKEISSFDELTATNQTKLLNLKYTSFMTYLFAANRIYQGQANLMLYPGQEGAPSQTDIEFAPLYSIRNSYDFFVDDSSEGSKQISGATKDNAQIELINAIKKAKNRPEELSSTEKQIYDLFTQTDSSWADSALRDLESAVSSGEISKPIKYGVIHSPYILVGDIIGAAYDNSLSNMSRDVNTFSRFLDNYKVVLGTIDITYSVGQIVGTESPEALRSSSSQKLSIDIAKIPIAYNYFAAWFVRDVVSKNLQTYPFKQFVKDFMNNCVLKLINNFSEWEKKYILNETLTAVAKSHAILKTFSDQNIEITYTDLPYDIVSKLGTKKIGGSSIRIDALRDSFLKSKISPFVRRDIVNQGLYKYAIIHSNFGGNIDKTGDYLDNLKSGIFHFYVGSTTGILKDIKFIPINSPQRQTALISNAMNDNSGLPLSEKFNVISRYDVDISCIGFQYFKPGQIIYVDTSLIGFGKSTQPNSIAGRFTLGGYYLVTKVSHDIDTNDFSTNIIAKFVSFGKAARV
jgi:hypothetical protein